QYRSTAGRFFHASAFVMVGFPTGSATMVKLIFCMNRLSAQASEGARSAVSLLLNQKLRSRIGDARLAVDRAPGPGFPIPSFRFVVDQWPGAVRAVDLDVDHLAALGTELYEPLCHVTWRPHLAHPVGELFVVALQPERG